ncbi:MAG: rhodanese-like domain-containing protein [Desulfobacterales bacterium]
MSSPQSTRKYLPRFIVIGLILVLAVYGSLAAARSAATPNRDYAQKQLLASAGWLQEHLQDPNLVVVDVRSDKYFDNRLVPGAIRLPWSDFQFTDSARGIGGSFVGIHQAQRMLGDAGLTRGDRIILYDSVERDGGATASYFFWVLDLLGHPDKKILERGIDGWVAAGGEIADTPRLLEAQLYQAPSGELLLERLALGDFIENRLGDRHYQILDVRSREEYLGQKPNLGLDGEVLKLGHIPTAYNIDYRLNWADGETKALKSNAALLELYRGLDPSKAVITYCHSARRGSFGYFVLRLMGFSDVRLYDGSWFEWGRPQGFYPVETRENRPRQATLPQVAAQGGTSGSPTAAQSATSPASNPSPEGGYVSCGG